MIVEDNIVVSHCHHLTNLFSLEIPECGYEFYFFEY